MNAYELADKLMSSRTMEYDCDKYMEQAATMLRQQADRIAELEVYETQIKKIKNRKDLLNFILKEE